LRLTTSIKRYDDDDEVSVVCPKFVLQYWPTLIAFKNIAQACWVRIAV